MTTIAEFRLPVAALPLGVAIERDPPRRIELERVVPTADAILPFFWVWGEIEDDSFVDEICATEAVRSIKEISRTADGRLYEARWNDEVDGFVRGISEIEATILHGSGTHNGWRFELRFGDRSRIREFQTYCHDHDVPVDLRRLYTPEQEAEGKGYGLTDQQRETLRRAYEAGYFETPQRVTQSELAEEFGISQRAISRRLRRAISGLVGETIAAGDDGS